MMFEYILKNAPTPLFGRPIPTFNFFSFQTRVSYLPEIPVSETFSLNFGKFNILTAVSVGNCSNALGSCELIWLWDCFSTL